MRFNAFFASPWTRFSAGVAAMLSLCWLNGARFTGIIDWEPTISFVVALMFWVKTCFTEEKHSESPALQPPEPEKPSEQMAEQVQPTEHDKRLYGRFTEMYDDNLQYFMRTQDMGAPFALSRMNNLREIAETWHGPNYQFDDTEIQAQFQELLETIRQFSYAIAIGTQTMQNPEWVKMPWNDADDAGSNARLKHLNDLADTTKSQCDQFLLVGRRRFA